MADPACNQHNRLNITNSCTSQVTYLKNNAPKSKPLRFGQSSLNHVCAVVFTGAAPDSLKCVYSDGTTGKPVEHDVTVSCDSNGAVIVDCGQ